MSNSISSTSNIQPATEVVQPSFSLNPLDPAHTASLRQSIGQIFEQCSAGPATLNTFIKSLKERCQSAELQGDHSNFDAAGVNKLHQLIVQKIQNFGIACPNRCLSPQEIHGYSLDIAAIEDRNLQRAWGVIRQAVIVATPAGATPLDPPAVDAPAAAIRTWVDVNVAALQQICQLNLSNRQLTCIPREIALLTGLQRLWLHSNQISELPLEIFNGLVGLQYLYLHRNQISELPVGIFNGLVGLQRLCLHSNQISELSVGIFNGLVGLQELYLNYNQISELPVGIFGGLVGLQELDLDDNQIRELPVGIFSVLVGLQSLSLDGNQIRELPVGIFNGLVSLQRLYLGGNSQLLFSYKELRNGDSSLYKNTFDAFHQYGCRSTFARFYQFAAQGHPLEEVIAAFHALDQTTKNAIYGMVYEEAGRPTTNDLQWGEHHAFDDKGIFNGALKRYVRGRFEALSESQKNAVYGRIRELAQGDFSNPNWGRDHAEDNVLRLIDAMMATPEALLDRKRAAIARLNQITSFEDQRIARFEANPLILTFNLDAILQNFNSNHAPFRLCELLDWAGVMQDKSTQFTAAIQHYDQVNYESGILTQTLLSKIFSFFNQKKNQPGQSQNILKAQFIEVVDKIIDANLNCNDQLLSQLQEIILDLVADGIAATQGRDNELQRIQFKVGHALAQYRSQLLKQICVRQNPHESHMAVLERLVTKRLARDLGLQGAIFEVGAHYAIVVNDIDMRAQRVMDAFQDEYKPLLFLVNELGSVHSNCHKLRTDMIQWADQHYALSEEEDGNVKDTDMNRLLSADYDAGLTAPFNYGGAWAPATALLLLEAAGLIKPVMTLFSANGISG